MARLLSRHLHPLKTLTLASPPILPSSSVRARPYITEMRLSAFKDNLLRILRAELAFEAESRPPSTPPSSHGSFSVEDRPGQQWIQLHRRHGQEEIKIDASMFDGAAPSTRSAAVDENSGHGRHRLHISLVVEVSKGDASDYSLQFVCSAWPDALDVENVFAVCRGAIAVKPYMGPVFKELDEEMQDAVFEYLEARGVNEELAGFLHQYMENKDRMEVLRWLRNVESYVKKK